MSPRRALLPAALVALVLASCAGIEARERALMPVMSRAWSVVIAQHVEAGVVASLAAGAMTADEASRTRAESAAMKQALDSGDRLQVINVNWDMLRAAALDGVRSRIDSAEIGPGVGMSLVETIDKFDEKHDQLLAR